MDTGQVSVKEIYALAPAYTDLPAEYFAYLRDVGSGEGASGRMIYSGPIAPQEVYGDSFERTDIVLLGDDLAGYCFGYDLAASTYGEVDPKDVWDTWPGNQGLRNHVGA